VLGWGEIAVRVVSVSSIAAGEYAENEMRKEFTPSERVAILETIERMNHGGDRRSDQRADLPVDDKAMKQVGFSSRKTANKAVQVVGRGVPELAARSGGTPTRRSGRITVSSTDGNPCAARRVIGGN
jgi:hypothetical protein